MFTSPLSELIWSMGRQKKSASARIGQPSLKQLTDLQFDNKISKCYQTVETANSNKRLPEVFVQIIIISPLRMLGSSSSNPQSFLRGMIGQLDLPV